MIVGGGVIGAASACFLARDHRASVTVLERDPSYRQASSALSASSIRQQFSSAINIALSQAGIEFLRRVGDELEVDGQRPAIGLVEAGYLYLASSAGAAQLRANHALQRAHGADIELLTPAALQARWPWLATDGLALGAHGVRGEGWFDGPALHAAFKRKAQACGARFVHADVVAFDARGDRVHAVRDASGRAHAADAVLVAAGAWSAPLAASSGLALPVHAEKRDVFVLDVTRTPARLPAADRPLRRLAAARRPWLHRRRAAAGRRGRRRAAGRDRPRPVRRRDLAHAGRAHPGLRSLARAFGLGRLLRDEPLRPQWRGRCGAGLGQRVHRLRLFRPRHAARAGRRPRDLAERIAGARRRST